MRVKVEIERDEMESYWSYGCQDGHCCWQRHSIVERTSNRVLYHHFSKWHENYRHPILLLLLLLRAKIYITWHNITTTSWYFTTAEMGRHRRKPWATRSAIKSPFWPLRSPTWCGFNAEHVDPNYRCNLSAKRTALGGGQAEIRKNGRPK